jgi:hypothetical protein
MAAKIQNLRPPAGIQGQGMLAVFHPFSFSQAKETPFSIGYVK